VLLFDNVKCDHRISPQMGCKEFRTSLDVRSYSHHLFIAKDRRR
jgi:hypothetical protein